MAIYRMHIFVWEHVPDDCAQGAFRRKDCRKMEKITIKDIAREAGVSVGLVSMALNGRSGVNRETSQKIMAVIKRLGYIPNKAASTLRMGYKKTIGVITPDLSDYYFSDISRKIENLDGVGHVMIDNDKAVRMGLDHLIANGYRHIEMVSNNVKKKNSTLPRRHA